MNDLDKYESRLKGSVAVYGQRDVRTKALRDVVRQLKLERIVSSEFVPVPTGKFESFHPNYEGAIEEVYDKNAEFNITIPEGNDSVLVSTIDPNFASVRIVDGDTNRTYILEYSADFSLEGEDWVDGSSWDIVFKGEEN